MRHAKAMKDSADGTDYQRDLEDRGKKDAQAMGIALAKTNYKPDFLVASPAKRTRKTAQLVAKELKLAESIQELDSHLYNAGISDLMYVIHQLNESYHTVMIVGHNPSMTSIIGYLTNTFAEHIPTSGIVVVSFNTKSWKLVQSRIGEVKWYINPKGIALV
ncbi:MAG: phosphohistidine phosphatase [Bacteroidetes bacterium B1(2017)]|nr:MAG: phosphohistidine phosphatase [Bacteroidetes bacterium B1(2017)]